MVAVFLEAGAVGEATRMALDVLLDDAEAVGPELQTRLLDATLAADRARGDELLKQGALSEAHKPTIAARCEALGLIGHALRLHVAPADVARVLLLSGVDEHMAVHRVGAMGPTDGLATLEALLRRGTPAALARTLALSRALWQTLGHSPLAALLATAKAVTPKGETLLLRYLAARMAADSTDAGLTLEYLRAARDAGRGEEVERVTRDRSITYEPHAVLAMLQEEPPAARGNDGGGGDGGSGGSGAAAAAAAALADPRPLLNVFDRFELHAEMATLFYTQRRLGHVTLYVQKVHPAAAPQVVGALLDAGLEPPRVAELIAPLGLRELGRDATVAARLVEACEARGQLSLLQPWLVSRDAEGAGLGAAGGSGLGAELSEESVAIAAANLPAVRDALARLAPKKAAGLRGLLG